MTTISEQKERLQALLPYGSYSRISREIKQRNGRIVSVDKITRVLNPKTKTWDVDVIIEAQKIAKEVDSKFIC